MKTKVKVTNHHTYKRKVNATYMFVFVVVKIIKYIEKCNVIKLSL